MFARYSDGNAKSTGITSCKPHKVNIIALAAAIAFCGIIQSAPAYSATFDQSEYQSLFQRAGKQGFVRVMISLDVDVPLEAISNKSIAIKSQLAAKENALLSELGDSVLKTSQWRNGIGQIGVYVTAEGIKRIASSANVRWFGRDVTDSMRAGVYDGGGLIAGIESEIERNGFADVEITSNLENLDFDIAPDGKTIHKQSSDQLVEVKSKLPKFLDSLPPGSISNLASLKANIGKPETLQPTIQLRVNKEGLFALKEHGDVRAIRLVNAIPAEPVKLDAEVLDAARKNGYADVIIDLRRPAAYSPQSGKLPVKAWRSQVATIRKTFTDIFSALNPDAVMLAQDFGGIASSSARISVAALERLYQNPDPRIQGVTLNKGVAEPQLAESMPWINMPQAWNKGYTANGQSIAVFDSGFEKTHPFLQNSAGQPKIVYEACFGAAPGSGYTTLCPSPNANGDSPLGMIGSSANCPTSLSTGCFHGTYVAGIAAGKRGWNGLSGMAPDASIIAVKVHSQQGSSLFALSNDIIAGMQALANNVASGEVTANLSIGNPNMHYSSTCSGVYQAFEDSVAQLNSLRIPVVAASANYFQRGYISWPACVPRVIKVAGTYDTSDQISGESNVIDPAMVDAPMLFAPGCTITSSNIGGGTVSPACGTSAAAPHVAGLYAVIKAAAPGISVADASAWILANGVAVPVFWYGYSIKRIHVPNL